MQERESLVGQLFACVGDTTGSPHDLRVCCAVADDLRVEGVVAFLLHGPVDSVRVCLSFGKEKLLTAVKGRSGELVRTGMQMFGVDGTSTSARPEQLGARRVPVDRDKRGDFGVMGDVGRDLEHEVDAGVFEIGMPSRTWMDAWLRACRRGGPCFVFLFLCDPGDLRVDVALHQGVYDVGKGGGGVQWVDLEELGGRRGHRGDRVGRGDGLTIRPKVAGRGSGSRDVEGMEVF